MEQWMCIWFNSNGFIESVHDKRIVIVITDFKGNDPPVIKIQNGAQVYLMDLDADVILELCHIGQPLLIRCICMKVTIQIVPGDVRRIVTAFGAAFRLPLDYRLDSFLAADSQNPLVIHCDAMLFVQFIPNPSISHIRMLFMNVFDLL